MKCGLAKNEWVSTRYRIQLDFCCHETPPGAQLMPRLTRGPRAGVRMSRAGTVPTLARSGNRTNEVGRISPSKRPLGLLAMLAQRHAVLDQFTEAKRADRRSRSDHARRVDEPYPCYRAELPGVVSKRG